MALSFSVTLWYLRIFSALVQLPTFSLSHQTFFFFFKLTLQSDHIVTLFLLRKYTDTWNTSSIVTTELKCFNR